MRVFVSRGATDHSLRIGVIPSAVAQMGEAELKATLRRDLAGELAAFVEHALYAVSQELEKTSPELADIITENTKEGNWSRDEQIRKGQGT